MDSQFLQASLTSSCSDLDANNISEWNGLMLRNSPWNTDPGVNARYWWPRATASRITLPFGSSEIPRSVSANRSHYRTESDPSRWASTPGRGIREKNGSFESSRVRNPATPVFPCGIAALGSKTSRWYNHQKTWVRAQAILQNLRKEEFASRHRCSKRPSHRGLERK